MIHLLIRNQRSQAENCWSPTPWRLGNAARTHPRLLEQALAGQPTHQATRGLELGVEVDESETAASQDLVEQLLHHQVVVWATSYRPDCGWIDLPIVDDAG
jgi:hypothetical protein